MLRFFDGEDEAARQPHPAVYASSRGSAAWALRASTEDSCGSGAARRRCGATITAGGYSARSSPRRSPAPSARTSSWNRGRFSGDAGRTPDSRREEDVDLGITVRAGAMLGAQGVRVRPERHRAARGRQGRRARPGRLRLSRGAGRRALRLGRARLAARCSSPATAVLQPRPQARGRGRTSRAAGSRIRCPAASSISGLGTGPRAFRSHAFTGDRCLLRDRRISGHRGRTISSAWWAWGSPVSWITAARGTPARRQTARLGRRHGPSAGGQPGSDTDALRFDLARRFGNDAQGGGWVVTVGKGFVFSPLGRRLRYN